MIACPSLLHLLAVVYSLSLQVHKIMTIEQIQNASLRLRNNKIFEFFVVSIIILSALLIGAKTYQISDGIMQLV
ncbi:MAG: hypothetical protein ACI9DG_002222, partial [Oleispira sp.]